MARFILKWRYYKSSSKRNSRYVKYIATRDGVEKCDDSWRYELASSAQKKLINSLVKDFPDSKNTMEYQDYISKQTKGLANEYINRTLEEYFDLIDDKENYIGYIANRPRVEKQGAHGLFSADNKPIDLKKVTEEIANHNGVVFTNILSLRREDADNLGYNCASKWRDLINRNALTIAKTMNISPQNLRWYAAFHNEKHHPHVHLVTYAVDQKPYMTESGLDLLKRTLAKDIFADENVNIYIEQTNVRNELKAEAKKLIDDIINSINDGEYSNTIVNDLLVQLTKELDKYSGRMMYGYLPKRAKNLIDGIVDEMSKDEKIQSLYDLWYKHRETIIHNYRDDMPSRISLTANNEFKSIRNSVLQEALRLKDLEQYPFTEELVEKIYIPPSADLPSLPKRYNLNRINQINTTNVALASTRIFARLTQAFRNDFDYEDEQITPSVDKKLAQEINEKKQAQGLKM